MATLSYREKFGWYNLRVQPGFEQVLGSLRNSLHIPIPDRSAKWEALSPYRALLLDAVSYTHLTLPTKRIV